MRKLLLFFLIFMAILIAGCSNSENCNQAFGVAPTPAPAPEPTPVPRSHSITGTVTGVVSQGVTVFLRNASGDIVAQAVIGADGSFAFNDIPDGDYTIGITPEKGSGYFCDDANFSVSGVDVTVNLITKSNLMNHIYSGTSNTTPFKIIETRDNCLAVVGWTNSPLPRTSPPYDTPSDYHSNYDIWVLKIDPNAPDKQSGILFNHCYGGSSYDYGYGITEMSDGTLAVTGHTASNDGDVPPSDFKGVGDVIVLRIDASDNADRGLLFCHTYGGSQWDQGRAITETSDGMLAIAGYTASNDGDIDPLEYKGNRDLYVLKINPYDNTDRGLLFSHCYGGSGDDEANGIFEMSDGMLAIVGNTTSDNGDIPASENNGFIDVLVLKVDASDNANRGLLFSHCYGGSGNDYGNGIIEMSSGELAVVGSTYSNDKDIKGLTGYSSMLVLKIDASNNSSKGLLFSNCYGGSDYTLGRGIVEIAEGQVAVIGYTESDDGDIDPDEYHGEGDMLLLKIDISDDADRGLLFSRCYGGESDEESGNSLVLCADGCIAICGYAYSNYPDGDIPEDQSNDYEGDYWVLKINNDGDYSL